MKFSLIIIAQNRQSDTICALLDHGTDSEKRGTYTPSSLSPSCQGRSPRTGKLLLVTVDAKEKDGETFVWLAAYDRRKAIMSFFLKLEAKVDTSAKDWSRRPIYQAAQHGHPSNVELLTAKGFDVDA